MTRINYLGSKQRIAKDIVPILQKYIDDNNIDTYYEPFVGGANVIEKIKCKNRIGNDIHKYLIAMWRKIQDGWDFPLHISEEEYHKVRTHKDDFPDYYVGLVGFTATFGSKWFNGYARRKNKGDIPNEALRNIKKQVSQILDVKFLCGDYRNNEYSNIKNAVVYCDPPYQNTTKFKTKPFDYDDFWDWCRKISKDNFVFISSYDAPQDFKCIWSKEILMKMNNCDKSYNADKRKRTEKLFIYEGGLADV